MALIKMTDAQGEQYRAWLDAYRKLYDKEPGPIERTEAFFCARSNDPWKRPCWIA